MRRLALAVALATLAVAAGCGSHHGAGQQQSGPRTAAPVPPGATPGLTSFGQAVAAEDGAPEVFPGVANSWTLDRNFALTHAFAAQYASSPGALDLWVGTVGTTTAAGIFDAWLAAQATPTPALREFPWDQAASEVTFLTPLFGPPDGVVTAAAGAGPAGLPVLAGARSGYLAGGADSRLVRTVTLAAGQAYTLSWREDVQLDASTLLLAGEDAAPYGPRYQVVLRDPSSGALLTDPLLATTSSGAGATDRTASFSTTPGPIRPGPVDLSFELRSGAFGYVALDAVGLSTTGGPVALDDGDFEAAGLSPWRAGGTGRSQNVRSAPRTVAIDPGGASTVAITRTFYAPPAAGWARMVDRIRNDGPAPASLSLLYVNWLGAGAPAVASAAGGKAAVARDTTGSARDLGIVFGDGVPAFDASSSSVLWIRHDVVVPAHGEVAVVHFVVQLGQGATGADHATTGTDAACGAIAAGFRTDPAYQADLEPGVLAVVKNL